MSEYGYLIMRVSKAYEDLSDSQIERRIAHNQKIGRGYYDYHMGKFSEATGKHPHWGAYSPEERKAAGFPDRHHYDVAHMYFKERAGYEQERTRRFHAREAARPKTTTRTSPRLTAQAVADAKPRGPGRKIALGVGLAGVGAAGTGAVVVRRRRNRE